MLTFDQARAILEVSLRDSNDAKSRAVLEHYIGLGQEVGLLVSEWDGFAGLIKSSVPIKQIAAMRVGYEMSVNDDVAAQAEAAAGMLLKAAADA